MLKNLKSLFIVEDQPTKDKPQESTSTPKGNKKAPEASSKPVVPAATPTAGAPGINEKIMDKLLAVLEQNNQEGFDYLEFKKSLKALSKMPMDEKTRFCSAFATAATMGATVAMLNESIQLYKKFLNQENASFLKALKDQVDEKVLGKENEVKRHEKSIHDKSEQIKKLTSEISQHQQQMKVITSKIEEDKQKIESTREEFTRTFERLMAQINYDNEKINEYIA